MLVKYYFMFSAYFKKGSKIKIIIIKQRNKNNYLTSI